MEETFVAYPIVITPEKNNEYYQYLVFLPDFGTYCQANTIIEALRVAVKFIRDYALTNELPPMKLELPHSIGEQLVTFVNVNLAAKKGVSVKYLWV